MTVFQIPDKDGKMRTVGEVIGEEFRKTVQRSKHFLKTPPAIAIEQSVFESLTHEFVTLIRVRDTELNQYWEVSYDIFNMKKIRIERGGYAPQYALTLDWFELRDGKGEVIRKARELEAKGHTTTAIQQSEKVAEALKGLKPEFGNETHIKIGKAVHALELLKGHKKPNKAEIDRLEKSILHLTRAV